MKREIKTLIKNFSDRIINNEAALFIGAGISHGSGYVNWKELMKDVAEELELDIDQENDLIEIAQFHENKNNSRFLLNKKLITEFCKDTEPNNVHHIIRDMKIYDYWTTNYDQLIEKVFLEKKLKFSVISDPDMLTQKLIGEEKRLYKMHGDISHPKKAVLTKNDYESYYENWRLFLNEFKSALINKTFLFLGFSFDDPNLRLILSRIKAILQGDARDHYCIMRRLKQGDFKDEVSFTYAQKKFDYKIKDLKINYGIEVVLVDEYDEIESILKAINLRVKCRNVFISGAASVYHPFEEENTNNLIKELAFKLAEKNFKITSGFGLGIGSSVINGALEFVFKKNISIDRVITMRPFPQGIEDDEDRKKMWYKYREEMIKDCGICVFMFGNKVVNNVVQISDGMIEEFEIAVKQGAYILPIGFTGFAAKQIYDKVQENLTSFFDDLVENSDFMEIIKYFGNSEYFNEDTIAKITKTIDMMFNSTLS